MKARINRYMQSGQSTQAEKADYRTRLDKNSALIKTLPASVTGCNRFNIRSDLSPQNGLHGEQTDSQAD